MRFQSNSAFSKLAPALATDPYGPCTAVTMSAASGATVYPVATPSSGNMLQLFLARLDVPTTASDAAHSARIAGSTTGVFILATYGQPNGVNLQIALAPMNMAEGIMLANTLTVTAVAHIWYRFVPIPT